MRKIFAIATAAMLAATINVSACSGEQSKELTSAPQCAKVTQLSRKPEPHTGQIGTSVSVYPVSVEVVEGASQLNLVDISRRLVLGWPADSSNKLKIALAADKYRIACNVAIVKGGKTLNEFAFDEFAVTN